MTSIQPPIYLSFAMQFTTVCTRAHSRRTFPSLSGRHVCIPKGIAPALKGPTLVDRTAVVPEDTVEVAFLGEAEHACWPHRYNPTILSDEFFPGQAFCLRQTMKVLFREKDISRLVAAARVASCALESKAVFIEGFVHSQCLCGRRDESRFGSAGSRLHGYLDWGEKDSNLRRQSQQIYSLPPLTTREPPHASTLIWTMSHDPITPRKTLSSHLPDSNRGPRDYKSRALAN